MLRRVTVSVSEVTEMQHMFRATDQRTVVCFRRNPQVSRNLIKDPFLSLGCRERSLGEN